MEKISFQEIYFASAKQLKELLDESVIWGGSYNQLFTEGDSLEIKRYANIVPGTLAPAACKVGVDMGRYVIPNADSETKRDLNEELETRAAFNKTLDNQIRDLIDKRCASEIVSRCLKAAKEYQDWTPPEFKREWTQSKSVGGDVFSISNAVYAAAIYIDRETWRKKPYRVSYTVRVREVRPTMTGSGQIVVQGEQFYAKYNEAMLCVERRKKAFDRKYFAEDYPAVPYEQAFMWAGAMLPGYRVEAEE